MVEMVETLDLLCSTHSPHLPWCIINKCDNIYCHPKTPPQKGPQTSEWLIQGLDFFCEDMAKEILCCLSKKQWLQGFSILPLKKGIRDFFAKIWNPLLLMWVNLLYLNFDLFFHNIKYISTHLHMCLVESATRLAFSHHKWTLVQFTSSISNCHNPNVVLEIDEDTIQEHVAHPSKSMYTWH